MLKTGAKTGLLGPYRLNFDTIDAAITRNSAGVYALGYTSPEGKFCTAIVTRITVKNTSAAPIPM